VVPVCLPLHPRPVFGVPTVCDQHRSAYQQQVKCHLHHRLPHRGRCPSSDRAASHNYHHPRDQPSAPSSNIIRLRRLLYQSLLFPHRSSQKPHQTSSKMPQFRSTWPCSRLNYSSFHYFTRPRLRPRGSTQTMPNANSARNMPNCAKISKQSAQRRQPSKKWQTSERCKHGVPTRHY
jgi:hypothetical protein